MILELLGDVRGREVLDAGCGDGELAVRLARLGARVTGLDASPQMLDAARQRAAEAGVDVRFLRGRVEELPFAGDAFDVVSAITLLCFVPDASRTFREIGRVLRPGGIFVIGELGRYSTWAAQRRLRAWGGNALWRQARFRTAAELHRLATIGGLEAQEIRGAVYYPRWAPAARMLQRIDPLLGRWCTIGAAFIAMRAVKRADSRHGSN